MIRESNSKRIGKPYLCSLNTISNGVVNDVIKRGSTTF